MSGIFGWCGHEPAMDTRALLDRMGARMQHLPHFTIESDVIGPGVGLGRIGIGIFNQTRQPIRSADGAVSVCLTGELYHQADNGASHDQSSAGHDDVSPESQVLRSYLEGGAEGVSRLNGMFSSAIWDSRSRELLLINDRFGLYPQYYAHTANGLAFAPEIKGVLCAPGVRKTLDRTAVSQYVRFQQLLGEHTWFEDIRMLRAATILRYRPDGNQVTSSRYWDWDSIRTDPNISFDEAALEFGRLFQRSIDARTSTSHRYGVYLSGGLDSRMVLGFTRPTHAVTTLTYGHRDSRDVSYAARVAQRANADHHWFPLDDGRWVLASAPLHLALVEGMHSWIHAHGMTTLGGARELFDVGLSGWLAWGVLPSKVWQGLPSDSDATAVAREGLLANRLYDGLCRNLTWPGLTEAEAATLMTGENADLRYRAYDSFRTELARTAHYPPDRRARHFLFEHQSRRSTLNLVVFTRAAVEMRCPFFDYDFVQFNWSVPPALRLNPQMRRTVLTHRMPHLLYVPYDFDDHLPHASPWVRLPHLTIQRARRWINRHTWPLFRDRPRLYADYEQYLRTDLRAWAEGLLFDARTEARGLFEPDAVRALWARHQSGHELWTIGKIAPLMTLELALRALHDDA